MNLQIKKASKKESKLRMGLIGPAGAGKTFSALSIGEHLGKKILVIDTERGSASKYADLFSFDVVELESFAPDRFIEVIEFVNKMPESDRYDVLIIDSLSHAWIGKDGVLEMHDNAAKRGSGNSFTAWRDVTPKHNALVDSILNAKTHIIATMRAKTEHVQEKDEKGRTVIRKIGMSAVQRDGFEYEFDVIADLDWENNCIIGKTRCPMLSGKIYNKAGANIAEVLNIWLQGEKHTTVKMPLEIVKLQAAEVPKQTIPEIAEPTIAQTPTDYTEEWNAKLANPVKKEVSVSPATKGRLLFEKGFVSQTAKGFEVTDPDGGLVSEVIRKEGKVVCNCEDFTEGRKHNDVYRCACIEAVKLSLVAKQQKAAA